MLNFTIKGFFNKREKSKLAATVLLKSVRCFCSRLVETH